MRGDFKADRVKDPTAPISSKHEKTVKSFVKDFMDKAVKKKTEREKEKAPRNSETNGDASLPLDTATPETPRFGLETEEARMAGALSSYNAASPIEPSGAELKRKRAEGGEPASPKKSRTDTQPIPPPPPPPTDDMPIDLEGSTLTPMDDDPVSVHSTSDGSVNGVRSKILEDLASPTQLATPPTKEHNGYHQHPITTESRS